ncbi:MAG: serine hydrolase, partial [Ilumatobacteraceae bacterium]
MRWIAPPSRSAPDDLGYGPRTWDAPQFLGRGQVESELRMPTAVLERRGPALPLPDGTPIDVEALTFDDPLTGRPMSGAQFLDRRVYTDGLLVFHGGGVRYETYRNGLRPSDRHILHSVSKTLTTMQMGIAIAEGRIDPALPLSSYLTPLRALPAWNDVTVQHVLDMATGIKCDEHYEDLDSMYWRYAEVAGYYGLADPSQGGIVDFVVEHLVELAEPPGHRFNYASYLTNLLPACLTETYGRPAVELFEEQLHQRLGCERDALVNCDRTGAPIV